MCTPKPIHRPYTQTFTPPEKQTPLPGHLRIHRPLHRPYTQTFTPPEKQTPLLGIEPAAPLPSWAPSRDVIPLHQSTTLGLQIFFLHHFFTVHCKPSSCELVESMCAHYSFHRCLFRVLDSFGTEPQFNFKAWKPTVAQGRRKEYGQSWGNWELNPRQFMTMYRKLHMSWVASYPGLQIAGGRPGIHCLRMRLI